MIDKMRLQAWLQLPDATRLNIFNETARRLGLPATAVEKDWWVVHTLALVFSMECAPALIFKGGTSLSKGWGLIQRFSEDIDLAIDREYLGYPGDLDRQTIKKLRKKSYEFMTTTFLQELTTKFTEAGFTGIKVDYQHTGQSDQDPLIVGIYYPKLTEPNTYQKRDIELEVGCRSLREPVTDRTFTTMVAEQFNDHPFADASITIPVVNPERTFLEKIFLLHEEFQKPADKIRVNRLSRHLYDIDKLSQSAFADLALNDTVLYHTIIDHRRRFTSIAGVDYENHSPDKLAFVPPTHLLRDWEADYRQMRENMIYGNPITFKELIQNLSTLQTRINNNTLVTELEITAFQQTEVGEIPSDWEVKRIEKLAIKVGSGKTPTGGERVYRTIGRPFVRSQNIGWGELLLGDIAFIDEQTHSSFLGTEIQKNDVFLNITGASIGRSSIANDGLVGGNVNQHVCIIRLGTSENSPQYLNHFLLSGKGQKQINDFQTGGNRQGLNFSQIKSILVSLPPTLAEQTAIATALTNADALITQLEKLIAKKKAIKQGAMQELLKPKEGWEEKKLSDLSTMKSGETITSKKISELDKYPCFGGNGLRGYTSKFTHQGSFTIIGRQGALCGNVQFASGNFFASEHAVVVAPKSSTDIKWLYYILTDMNLNQYSESSAQPGLSVAKILSLPVLAPMNKEQTRIAQILSDMDAEIEKLEQRLVKQKMLKQGMMQALLTGKIRLV